MNPRRRGRVDDGADQRDHHRHHEHVADEVEVLVAEQVDERERARRDDEVGVEVHPAADVVDETGPDRPVLDRRLDEHVEVPLERHDVAGMLEGRGRLAEHFAANEPVEPIRAAEQQDLPQQVPHATGQQVLHHRPRG
jgi:hypothetical protein